MRRLIAGVLLALLLAAPAAAATREAALKAMSRATRFMVGKVSVNGGYVWAYLPDGSRRWGELEAYPSMIWIQPPGTATMGNLFLDAFHATGDEQYYRAAESVAGAIVAAQHPSGGWHYFADFAVRESRKRWYATIGRNAWRMEEFQHDWPNATFDDEGTIEAATFLLRLYAERRDPRWKPALDRAVGYVLDSQYPNGGWPQRYPLTRGRLANGHVDYSSYVTFNDAVASGNIDFLLLADAVLGEPRAMPAVRRAMEMLLATQLSAPQAGWGLQYTPDLKLAAARSYEPRALATSTTAENAGELMRFYRWTGDRRFLDGAARALDWLDSVRLAAPRPDGRTHPTFIEPGTNQPLYVHRRGSNVVNGLYYVDHNPERTLGHYSGFRRIDADRLRGELEKLRRDPPTPAIDRPALPRFAVSGNEVGSDLNAGPKLGDIDAIIAALDSEGRWLVPFRSTSHRYAGPGAPRPAPGDFASTHVGDATDTSPFPTDQPVSGISISAYMRNMAELLRFVARAETE